MQDFESMIALRDYARSNDLANRVIEPDPPGFDIMPNRCVRWDRCDEGFNHRGVCRSYAAPDTEPGILERLRRYSS